MGLSYVMEFDFKYLSWNNSTDLVFLLCEFESNWNCAIKLAACHGLVMNDVSLKLWRGQKLYLYVSTELEMMSEKLVISNIASAPNQWYSKDSVFWLAQILLYHNVNFRIFVGHWMSF